MLYLTGSRVGALGEKVLNPVVNNGLQEGGPAAGIESVRSVAIIVSGERAGIFGVAGSVLRLGHFGVNLHLKAHSSA